MPAAVRKQVKVNQNTEVNFVKPRGASEILTENIGYSNYSHLVHLCNCAR